jgi:hypothetical protein
VQEVRQLCSPVNSKVEALPFCFLNCIAWGLLQNAFFCNSPRFKSER